MADLRTGAEIGLPANPAKPYDEAMEARVAVLEQIAKDTKDVLTEMRQDMRDFRQEMKEFRHELKEIRQDMKIDFRLQFGSLISVALGLSYLMARGFHWL